MSETQTERCGKCSTEIDPSRRVDFTLKNGSRVCEPCFIKETPQSSQLHRDWSNPPTC
jgi:recombinational DNA repair protein (RecF pathway)